MTLRMLLADNHEAARLPRDLRPDGRLLPHRGTRRTLRRRGECPEPTDEGRTE